MAEAATRKRNTRLSAYYGLQQPSSPSVPLDREAAIRHADHLAKSLPLADLLTKATELRQSSEALQTSLHTSVRQYYEHLSAASSAAHEATQQARALTSSADAVRACAQRCAAVDARLAASRAAVDRLEGARHAMLLQTAAQQLAQQLAPAYRELVDLCTDPAAARARLFLVAQRTAAVLPAVLKMRGGGFAEAAEALGKASSMVRAEIRARGDEDDPYGLGLVDAIHLRRLLGDSPEELREAFWAACGRQICRAQPSEAAKQAASRSGVAMASLFVSFAADQIMPEVYAVADRYVDIFGAEAGKGGEGSWHDFVVWLSDTLDEAVGSRVRKALNEKLLSGDDEEEDIRAYQKSMDKLQVASASAVATQMDQSSRVGDAPKTLDERSNTCLEARSRVNEVVMSITEDLRTRFTVTISEETSSRWQSIVDAILFGQREENAVLEVLGVVRQICGRKEWVHDTNQGTMWTEARLLMEIGQYVAAKALADGAALETIGRASIVCQELAKSTHQTECAKDLRVISEMLIESIRKLITERVEDIIQSLLVDISRAGNDSSRSSPVANQSIGFASRDVSEIVSILHSADAVGKTNGILDLRIEKSRSGMLGSDLFLGDDDTLISKVSRLWMELVRRCSIASEAGVHLVQVDAWDVGQGIGQNTAFAQVVQAALERCSDGEASLLEEGQVLDFSRHRALFRKQ